MLWADSRMCGYRNPGWILWSAARLGREWGIKGRSFEDKYRRPQKQHWASSLAEVGEAEAGVLDTAAPERADGHSRQALGCVLHTHILCPHPHEAPQDRGRYSSFLGLIVKVLL